MSDDDVSRADALRATNTCETRRRTVLGGVVAAIGTVLGLSGTAGASVTTRPGPGGPGQRDAPNCPDGCIATPYCCNENCSPICWYCDCS